MASVIETVSMLDLESERKYATQSTKVQRVKLERGHAWLVRFVPFPMSKNHKALWYARLARHWIANKPTFCKRHTAVEFGGDPGHQCAICEVSEAMHQEADSEADRNDFYRLQARVAYLTYCLVFKKEDDRGKIEDMSEQEILVPYTFDVSKDAFALLMAKIERSRTMRNAPPMGLLDLENGTDIWAIRDRKNSTTFDLADSGPIFDLNDTYDQKMNQVWKQLKQPIVKFLDVEREAAIAEKIEEHLFEKAADIIFERSEGGGSSRGRGGSSRGRDRDDENAGGRSSSRGRWSGEREADADGERQSSGRERNGGGRNGGGNGSSRSTSSRFAQAQAAIEDPQNQEDNSNPELMPEDQPEQQQQQPVQQQQQPVRRTSRTVAQPVEQAQPEQQQEEVPAEQAEEQAPVETQAEQQEEAPPTIRRAAGATRQVTTPPAVAAARRSATVTTPSRASGNARPAAASGAVQETTNEDEDTVPEENRDPAPPVQRQPVTTQRTAAPAAAGGVARTSQLSATLKNSIATIRKGQ